MNKIICFVGSFSKLYSQSLFTAYTSGRYIQRQMDNLTGKSFRYANAFSLFYDHSVIGEERGGGGGAIIVKGGNIPFAPPPPPPPPPHNPLTFSLNVCNTVKPRSQMYQFSICNFYLKFEGIAKSILFNSILNFAILSVLI